MRGKSRSILSRRPLANNPSFRHQCVRNHNSASECADCLPRAGDLREIQVWGRNCIKQRRRRRPRASSTIALRASLVPAHSHASWVELVPVLQPKLRAGPGSSHLSVRDGTEVPRWRQAAHACGPNPLTFPTHGLGRAGIYRLPMAQSVAAPPPPSAASDVESGLETTAPPPSCARAHGCAALLLPDRKLTAAGVLPKVLLHCVSSCAVPPAAPALRWSVCPLPCCVRAVLPAACAALLAIFMRCVLARDALAYFSLLPPALAGVLPKVLLHCVSSCAVPPAAPALRWLVCLLPCCVRAVLPAACAALLAISMRCVLARDALAYLSRLPPALAGVLPKVLLHCVSSCAVPPAAPALRWLVCPLPCCVRAVLPAACAALLAISMRCVLARDALAYFSRLPPALAGVLPKVLLHCVSSCAVPPAAPALRWLVCLLPCCVRAVLPAACAASLAISMRCVLARDALAYLHVSLAGVLPKVLLHCVSSALCRLPPLHYAGWYVSSMLRACRLPAPACSLATQAPCSHALPRIPLRPPPTNRLLTSLCMPSSPALAQPAAPVAVSVAPPMP